MATGLRPLAGVTKLPVKFTGATWDTESSIENKGSAGVAGGVACKLLLVSADCISATATGEWAVLVLLTSPESDVDLLIIGMPSGLLPFSTEDEPVGAEVILRRMSCSGDTAVRMALADDTGDTSVGESADGSRVSWSAVSIGDIVILLVSVEDDGRDGRSTGLSRSVRVANVEPLLALDVFAPSGSVIADVTLLAGMAVAGSLADGGGLLPTGSC